MKRLILNTFVVVNLLVALMVFTTSTAWADNVIYRDASNSQQTAPGVNMLEENSLSMVCGRGNAQL